jgi:transcriptional regulator with XRE-family HTH domain
MAASNRLRQLREAQGLSLRDLGRALGMSYAQLSKVETGDSGISDGRKRKIAAFFGVTVGDLFFGEGVENQETEAVA